MIEGVFNSLQQAVKSLLSLLKVLVRSNLFLPKLSTSTSKKCFILGNGPSLKTALNLHSPELAKHTLLCVNNFPNTVYFTQLKPVYYLFVASGYYNPESIKHEQDTRDAILKALVENTSWPLTIFCPAAARKNSKFCAYLRQNENLHLDFFNTTPIEGLDFVNKLFFKLGLGMPRPHNVLIPSIMIAINKGFKQINLLGADHSWLPLISVNDKNEALVNQQHFYKDKSESNGKMYKKGEPRSLHQILEKFMLSFRAYFVLKDFAASLGVKIYNCTPNSFIDAFERKNLDEMLLPESAVEDKLTIS
jgi:hypothetical protein